MSTTPETCPTCNQAFSPHREGGFVCPNGHRLHVKMLSGEVTATASLQMKADRLEDAVANLEGGSRWRRIAFPLAALLGAAIVFAAAWSAGDPSRAIGVAGVLFDIAGAGLLTLGLIFTPRQVKEMGTARFNGNPLPRAYWNSARSDAYIALLMLVLGFAMQAVASALT